MKPIRTPRTNTVDMGPVGTTIAPLPSWREADPGQGGTTVVFSVWQPTDAERAAIAIGANILLGVWQDPIPPVYVGVVQGEEFEPLVRLEVAPDPPKAQA